MAPDNCQRNPAYFRGLNHLLNEEPDKAIDVFVEMLAPYHTDEIVVCEIGPVIGTYGGRGTIGVVSAGSSDRPVTFEAAEKLPIFSGRVANRTSSRSRCS